MKDVIRDICKVGQGTICCRYLLVDRYGFECGKLNARLKALIDERVDRMIAQGDNCDGQNFRPKLND